MIKDTRKEKLIRLAKEGKPVVDIARELGMDASYIYKVIKINNIQRHGVIKTKNVLSPVHQLLGKMIRKERIYKNEDESKKDFTNSIGISTQRLNWIERGHYDPTLTDLIKLFGILEIKFSEIDKLIEQTKTE